MIPLGQDSTRPHVRLPETLRVERPPVTDEEVGKPAIKIHPDGRFFVTPAGARISCGRRPAMRGMMLALVEHHREHPGEVLTHEQLIEAGWPGERIMPEAARNRLHVTLSRLRSLGLREVLHHQDGGWRLREVDIEYTRAHA